MQLMLDIYTLMYSNLKWVESFSLNLLMSCNFSGFVSPIVYAASVDKRVSETIIV